MSIVAASQESTILGAALAYLELGISVLPVIGKQAAVSWSTFQYKRAPFSYVHNWHRNGRLKGVGIICGAVSGNLCVIDLDGVPAVAKFEFQFPDLLDTYTVISGSGKGKHIYLYADILPATTRTQGFELRADGCYVVAPPSLHPDTNKPYMVSNPIEVKRVSDLSNVVNWITDMIRAKQSQDTQRSHGDGSTPAIKNAYGLAALSRECANVRAAAVDVNNALNRAAFKLGQLIAAGCLDYATAESELRNAAGHLSERDGERATIRTIKSGLTAGMSKPPLYRKGL